MATINDLEALLDLLAKASEGMTLEEYNRAILGELKQQYRGDKIYVPVERLCKKDKIAEAARNLPTGVVAQRYGVHPSYVRKIFRRK